jgi:hypothetical protein
MTEQDTCPTCQAEIRYSITHDAYICTGCGTQYSWPMRPADEPPAEPDGAAPLDEPAPEANPEQEPQ